MAGGSSYDDDDGGGGLIVDINVTPLVDVILVLLIVFMITVPTIVSSASIQVDLPKASSGRTLVEAKHKLELTLQRRPDGGVVLYADGERIAEDEISRRIPELLDKYAEVEAVVAADRGIPYGDVVRLIDTLKGLGIKQLALNTEAPR